MYFEEVSDYLADLSSRKVAFQVTQRNGFISQASPEGKAPSVIGLNLIDRGRALTDSVTQNPVIKGDFKQSTEFLRRNPVLKFIYRKAKTPWLSEEQRQLLRAQRAVLP